MTQNNDLLEKIVLGEIEGKNLAIHAYDSIIWKVRTGSLILMFGGWAIFLKSIVEKPLSTPDEYRALILGLMLSSLLSDFRIRYSVIPKQTYHLWNER